MHIVEPVPIHLDKPRTLLLTLPALKAIEDQIAKQRGEKRVNLFRLFQHGDLGAMEMLVVLWGGLRHEDTGLTLEKTLALCTTVSMGTIAAAVRSAVAHHIGMPEAAAETPPAASDDGGPPPLA